METLALTLMIIQNFLIFEDSTTWEDFSDNLKSILTNPYSQSNVIKITDLFEPFPGLISADSIASSGVTCLSRKRP